MIPDSAKLLPEDQWQFSLHPDGKRVQVAIWEYPPGYVYSKTYPLLDPVTRLPIDPKRVGVDVRNI